jgi:hypothetical protein
MSETENSSAKEAVHDYADHVWQETYLAQKLWIFDRLSAEIQTRLRLNNKFEEFTDEENDSYAQWKADIASDRRLCKENQEVRIHTY